MHTRLGQISLLVAAMACNLIPRWLESEALYYKGQAVSILLWVLVARFGNKDELVKIAWDWTILLAINNCIDELGGYPTHASGVEVSIAIFITIWTLYKVIRCLRRNTRK